MATAALAVGLGLWGCSDDNPWGGTSSEKGSIQISLTTDSDLNTAKPSVPGGEGTRASGNLSDYITLPAADDFSISLEKKDGSYAKIWNTLADFKAEAKEAQFSTGAYTITASYGKKGEQGIAKPYFEASETFTVLSDQTAKIDLTADLQNSMTVINYTEAFTKYMDSYTAHLHTEGNTQDVSYAKGETRPAFVEPSTVSLSLDFKTTSGKEAFLEIGNFAAVAKTLHNITLDVKEPDGNEASLEVKFDYALTEEIIEIPLTDEAMKTPAPEITCVGFENGATEMLESTSSVQAIKMNVKAKGKLKSAILTVQADNGERPAWGGEADLCAMTEGQQAAIKQSGIEAAGFFKNRDVYAILDLTGFGKSMKKGRYTVSLVVTDEKGQTCEPATVVIECQQIVLGEVDASSAFASKRATVTVDYNGTNPDTDVSFSALNAMGNYEEARVISCEEKTATRSFETKQYVYTIEVPVTPAVGIKTKVFHCGNEKGNFEIPVAAPDYSIAAVDAFSRYAYLKISNTSGDKNELAAITKFLRVKSGAAELRVVARDEAEGIVTVTGLKPDNSYALESSAQDEKWNSENLAIQTETELDIPNGDFEQPGETLKSGTINSGGQYQFALKYQLKSSFSYTLPSKWATINNKTAYSGSSNKNTWFIVPSSWHDNGQGYMRNVGYSHNGTTPEISTSNGSSTNYCKNAPSTLDYAAGEIFLGSYSFDGSEHRNDGISFASRPSEISFDYKYLPVGGDTGFVSVEVLGKNDKVLGNGQLDLSDASVSQKMKISLKYAPFAGNAVKIKVIFKSSGNISAGKVNIPTGDQLNQNYRAVGNHEISVNEYKAVATGSELWIDNVEAHYAEAPGAAPAAAPKRSKNAKTRR